MAQAQTELRDLCILNTRPAHQQSQLNALLDSQGARVLSFPTIDIAEVETTPFLQSLNENIAHYHIALFVSRNAVDGAFKYLNAESLPADLQLGVIGEATYQALASKVKDLQQRLIRNQPYNSEALLNAGQLQQVAGKNILIFRGQQGRTLLSDELQRRGATVNHCEVYQRRLPQYAEDDFNRLTAQKFPDLVLLTSSEGMHNLLNLVDAQSRVRLMNTAWLLISERMRETALNLGHNASISIATIASDAGIAQSICDWAQRK